MFSDVRGELRISKETYAEKVRDSFGESIVSQTYEPFEHDMDLLAVAWEEAEMKRLEIAALTVQLRVIL